MENQDEKKKQVKQYATIANEIARNARISLTCSQYNILLFMISRIKRDDAQDKWYRVSVQELCDALSIDLDSGGAYYSRIKKDIKRLREGKWCKAGNGELLDSWLSHADITDLVKVDDNGKMTVTGKFEIGIESDENEVKKDRWSGMIHYQFNQYIAPFLFQLTGNYTMIELRQFATFERPRSIRLYMLLKSFVYREKIENNEPIFINKEIEKLEKLMLYGENQKEGTSYKFFVRDVIKPGVEEINKKTTEFHVDYTFETNGYEKRYKNIKFIITKAGQAQVETANHYQALMRKSKKKAHS
jgi:plasmid replication initiation protein